VQAKTGNDAEMDTKNAAIQAAMERAKAKKAAAAPKNIEHLTEQQQRLIDEVEQRRKSKTNAPQTEDTTP
jgi:hypothetical protein